MRDIEYRYSTLKIIGRKHIQDKEYEDDKESAIIDNLKESFFDKFIEEYEDKQKKKNKKITYKISKIIC